MNGEQYQPDLQRYKTDEGYARSMMQQTDPSVLIYQLQTDDILEELEMNLKGFDYDANEGKYIPKRDRIINNKGLSIIMTLLKMELNKTKILSYYEDEDVKIRCKEFEENLVDILKAKYKEWEIDINFLSSIRAMLGNAVYSAYMRALKGGERAFLKGTEKRIETYSERERNKGMLGGLGLGKSRMF